MIVAVLLLIVLALTIFHFATRYSRHGRIVNRLPGYTAYPLIGNLWRFSTTDQSKLWDVLREMTRTFYPMTKIWFVRTALISVFHPDDLQILLSSQKAIDKGYNYNDLQLWLKTGLLTSTGEKWRNRRKILTPAFHFNVLKMYLKIINEQSKRCVAELHKEGEVILKDAAPFSSNLTLHIICESAMGVALNKAEQDIVEKYKRAIHDFGYVTVYRMARPYVFDWVLELPWKIGRMQKNALKVLGDFTKKVVEDRKTYHSKHQNKFLEDFDQKEDDRVYGRRKRMAMLDLLLAAENDGFINYEGILEEVDTFTFEGHDTTGMAITFALLLLAENKEAQDLAREEVTNIMDRCGGKLEISDLQDMPYLEMCLKEAMRLYPPVPTILRYLADDLQLKHGLIPAGSHLLIHIFDTHRDANFWPDPDKFDPDRFLPENTIGRHPFAYIPFSAGPRNCIGQKFAMMELKSTFAHILYDFYLEPVTGLANAKMTADIVIRPKDSVMMKFVVIKKNDAQRSYRKSTSQKASNNVF